MCFWIKCKTIVFKILSQTVYFCMSYTLFSEAANCHNRQVINPISHIHFHAFLAGSKEKV